MNKYTIKTATRFTPRTPNGESISSLIHFDNIPCRSCTVVIGDGTGSFESGKYYCLPPSSTYTAKDGTKKVDRPVVFTDRDAVNAACATLVANGDESFKKLATPRKITGGEIVGFITVSAELTLSVRVEDGKLKFPFRKYTVKNGDAEEARYESYVWPFTTRGEELEAEKNAMADEIRAAAVDWDPNKKKDAPPADKPASAPAVKAETSTEEYADDLPF